jgi:hypothetical protein
MVILRCQVSTAIAAWGFRTQARWVEMRTVAGPSSAVQWVLSGGPYTVASHVRHVHVVWPPPCPRHA